MDQDDPKTEKDGAAQSAPGAAPEKPGAEDAANTANAPDAAGTPDGQNAPNAPDAAKKADKPGAADGSGAAEEEPAELPPKKNARPFKITLPEEAPEPEPEEKREAEEPAPRRRGMRALRTLFYVLFVLLASVALAGTFLFTLADFVGMYRPENPAVQVTVPSGATAAQMADILHKDGVIRFPKAFELYAKVTHKTALHKGVYTLTSDMSYQAILVELRTPAARATVKVMVPEGDTLQQIGALLEKDGVCSQQDFLTAAGSSSVRFDFSAQIPDNSERFYRLEGYLFPDTYEFYKQDSATAVVQKMLDNFDTRFDASLRKQAASSGMTVDQIVTLASIIQKEAGAASEMANVSSVFHNRLANGVAGAKFLQSDATIFYVTRDITPVLTTQDTQLASAYNTYKHEGLPPGAICNPGLDAIRAAMSPAKTNYYFFVTDKSGRYYYAATYKQHLANVARALKSGQAGGTNVVS